MADKKTVKVKLVTSLDRHPRIAPCHRARPGPASTQQRSRRCEDTPAVRGMINKVSYLVKVLVSAAGTQGA